MSWLAAVAAAAALASAPAEPFDFRGAELGMTLDAWRAMPLPTQLFRPSPPYCSEQNNYLFQTEPFAPGLVACTYPFDLGRGWMAQRVGASGEITSAGYFFESGRLFRIRLMATSDSRADIVAGLTERFGPPAKVEHGDFQTAIGAKFQQEILTWERPGQRIVVTSPDERVDRITVIYTDLEGEKRAAELRRRVNPAANRM